MLMSPDDREAIELAAKGVAINLFLLAIWTAWTFLGLRHLALNLGR
jgi:hypothetical protein